MKLDSRALGYFIGTEAQPLVDGQNNVVGCRHEKTGLTCCLKCEYKGCMCHPDKELELLKDKPEIRIDRNPLMAALDRYGPDAQVDVLLEEMAELTFAILKARRSSSRCYLTNPVIEEIADVRICLESLQIILQNYNRMTGSVEALIQQTVYEKLDRLKKRMAR